MIVLFTLLFSYLGFGLFLLRFIKLKFTVLEKLLFSLVLGISVLSLFIILFGYLIGTQAYFLLIPSFIIGLFILWHERFIFARSWQLIKTQKLLLFLFFLAIATLITSLFFSGFIQKGYLNLQNTHGAPWHISLIKECLTNLPPQHPSNPKILLINYHYFYDVFIASLGFFSQLPIFQLYFQVNQLLLATLLVLSAFVFGRRFISTQAGVLLVFFTVFVGSFAYLIPLFLPGQSWSESSFWVSQTFSMMNNPQLVFSFVVFFLVLTLFTGQFYQKSARHFLIMALIIPSIGFKSYAWILLSLFYAMDLLINLIKSKNFIYIIYGLIYLILSLPLIYLLTGFQNNSFFYHPLWFIDTMIEAPDRLNFIKWRLLLDHYTLAKNYPRVLSIRILEIAIFYLGNLGTRIIFLLLPIWRLRKAKFLQKQLPLIDFLLILFLISSVFPLLFLQRGTVWNTIQFWYYALIFANILSVLVWLKISKNWQKWQKIIATVLLVALSILSFLQTLINRWQNFERIPENQVKLLKNLDVTDKILICPDDNWWYQNSIVSSLTAAEVYLADPGQLNLVNLALSDFVNLEKIFNDQNFTQLETLIEQENINHILCTDQKSFAFIGQLNWSEQSFKNWNFFSAASKAK